MKCQILRCLVIALVMSAAAAVGAESAWAQSEHETSRDSGPVIRHKVLYRSTRLELAPLVGFSVNDSYMTNMLAGAALSYHLTNEWGISVVGGYGVTQIDMDLRTNTEAILKKAQPDTLEDLSYSFTQWLLGAEVSYVPIIGKFSLFNSLIAHYDVHVVAGFAFVGESAVPAVSGRKVDPQLEGLRPAPVVGLGARLFVTDGISLNLEVRDYLYNHAEVSTRSANPEFRNNVMVSAGVSFFLPQTVKISR